MNNRHNSLAYRVIISDLLIYFLEIAIYFISFTVPFFLFYRHIPRNPFLLAALIFLGWFFALLIFALLLILLRILLMRKIPQGKFITSHPVVGRYYFFARLLNNILKYSPFKNSIMLNPVLRLLFYRGLGMHFDSTLILGDGVVFFDPWFISLGRNVSIGAGVNITGHVAEGEMATFDKVEIGDNVTIGAYSLIFPGVKIGDGAIVGAKSLVLKHTVIPPKEVWAGIPAEKIR